MGKMSSGGMDLEKETSYFGCMDLEKDTSYFGCMGLEKTYDTIDRHGVCQMLRVYGVGENC